MCREHGKKEQHVYTSNGRNVALHLSKRAGSSEFLIHFKGRQHRYTHFVQRCEVHDITVTLWKSLEYMVHWIEHST